MKKVWADLMPEKRATWVAKMVEARQKLGYEPHTPEWKAWLSEEMKKMWAKRTAEERDMITQKRVDTLKAKGHYEWLAEENRGRDPWANATAEKRVEAGRKVSAANKVTGTYERMAERNRNTNYWEDLPVEEREARVEKQRETAIRNNGYAFNSWVGLTEEEKAERIRKSVEGKKRNREDKRKAEEEGRVWVKPKPKQSKKANAKAPPNATNDVIDLEEERKESGMSMEDAIELDD